MSSAQKMKTYKKELLKRYRAVGIRPGDTVFLHAQLFAFGRLADDRNEFVKLFIDPLKEAVDFPRGTIAAITFTTSYSSFAKPFVYETSPSEAGILTEYVRTMPGAVRSFHPIGSVTAVGKNAKKISGKITRSQFGWGSVYHHMHQLGAKGLYLGMTLGETCSFMHYVEHLYGVSHCYHKAFFTPVYKKGKKVKGPFLAFLRNRKSTPYDFKRFEKHMQKKNMVKATKWQNAPIQVVRFVDCFDEGMKLLDKDSSYFIQKPFYVTE